MRNNFPGFESVKIRSYFKHQINAKIREYKSKGWFVFDRGCNEGDQQCWAIMKREKK